MRVYALNDLDVKNIVLKMLVLEFIGLQYIVCALAVWPYSEINILINPSHSNMKRILFTDSAYGVPSNLIYDIVQTSKLPVNKVIFA